VKTFAQMLREKREHSGLSRRELADKLGCEVGDIALLEQQAARPNKPMLLSIFDALEIKDMGERSMMARAAKINLGVEAPALPPEDMRAWLKQQVDAVDDDEIARLFPALWLLFGKDT
jgi:transcriptional regulator with XRE-family HTH domain